MSEYQRKLESHKSLYYKPDPTPLPTNVTRWEGKFCYSVYGKAGDPNVGGHIFNNLEDLPALKLKLKIDT